MGIGCVTFLNPLQEFRFLDLRSKSPFLSAECCWRRRDVYSTNSFCCSSLLSYLFSVVFERFAYHCIVIAFSLSSSSRNGCIVIIMIMILIVIMVVLLILMMIRIKIIIIHLISIHLCVYSFLLNDHNIDRISLYIVESTKHSNTKKQETISYSKT